LNDKSRLRKCPANFATPFNSLKARVRKYFYSHPEVAREAFLLDALRRELQLREGAELRIRQGADHPNVNVSRVTERLAAIAYQQHGVWPRIQRTLAESLIGRWLGMRPESID